MKLEKEELVLAKDIVDKAKKNGEEDISVEEVEEVKIVDEKEKSSKENKKDDNNEELI